MTLATKLLLIACVEALVIGIVVWKVRQINTRDMNIPEGVEKLVDGAATVSVYVTYGILFILLSPIVLIFAYVFIRAIPLLVAFFAVFYLIAIAVNKLNSTSGGNND